MTELTTAEVIYSRVVRPLPPSERLKLATMILNAIPPQSVIDVSEEWTEDDIREAMLYSFRRATRSFEEGTGNA